ncbi:hypothetical protein EDEG_03535 [Edhazardia aedis USNM 41457]|uniref:Uncharacterized protein n=1 Tax=Edhazardia aedis (strain USNM 41457) TaxID=1003232 RepID=J9DHD1_EDHAE|nr:hypothetical protein EDEG_03535 [Edhazardia aedis USNM 41457]|eukprot:EJW02010.1 hypothetical protein EDEG_03535 [Edhazardia aedis USNM 41457]
MILPILFYKIPIILAFKKNQTTKLLAENDTTYSESLAQSQHESCLETIKKLYKESIDNLLEQLFFNIRDNSSSRMQKVCKHHFFTLSKMLFFGVKSLNFW